MPAQWVKLPVALAARPDLPASAKLVYAMVTDRMNAEGVAWPGMRRLAADTGLGVSTISRAVAILKDKGLLTTESRGNGRPPLYRCPVLEQKRSKTERAALQNETPTVPKRNARVPERNGGVPKRNECAPKWNKTRRPIETDQENQDLIKPPWTDSDVQALVDEYPRHQGDGIAQDIAVKTALQQAWDAGEQEPVAALRQAVKQAMRGKEEQFIPGLLSFYRDGQWRDHLRPRTHEPPIDQGGGHVSAEQRARDHQEFEASAKRDREALAAFRERWATLPMSEQEALIDRVVSKLPEIVQGRRDPLKCVTLRMALSDALASPTSAQENTK